MIARTSLAHPRPLPQAGGESFSLVLSTVTPAAELQAWFDAAPAWPARAGEAIYAAGVVLPRAEAAVQLVARWLAEKRVATHQVRDPREPRRWQYLVRKLPIAAGAPHARPEDGAGCPVIPARAVDRSELAALVDALRGNAARGEPCPSNNDLAQALGLPRRSPAEREKSRLRIVGLMARAAREGAIRVECRGTVLPRIVTILAPGRAQGRSTKS